ncbi:MAG: type II secretion system F family protein [Candidatus Thorarchaeota archaeon]|nr:type II secretion system F family protein [Candidatus Thorarchaeota archaeon]
MGHYEQLCRLGERLGPLARPRASGADRELSKATVFLRPLMVISVEGVTGASRLITVIAFLVGTIGLTLLGLSIAAAVPMSLMLAVLSYYGVTLYPVSLMNSYKVQLSEESDIMFEQFILVFQSGGSIFDAIELVAQSDHPYLSAAFRRILADVEQGKPPEEALVEFGRSQPSEDLRRYLTGVVSALEQKTELLDLLSGESYEADMTLRSKNLELESRLLIVSALITYVPMLITLALSLTGMATSPLVIVVAPLFVILSVFVRTRFSRDFASYFDRPRERGVAPPAQSRIMAEYDEFLNFLMLLGERMRTGDTLEVALPAIRDELAPESQRLADMAITSIYAHNEDVQTAFNRASEMALGERVSRMMKVIPAMAEVSALDAGERIVKMAGKLIRRSALARERESILSAQRVKVYLLSLTSAVVLGLLASLAPFLYIGSLLSQGPSWTPGATNVMEMLPLLVTLVVITYSAGHQNTLMVGGRRPRAFGLVCALLFWTSYVTASALLGLGNWPT